MTMRLVFFGLAAAALASVSSAPPAHAAPAVIKAPAGDRLVQGVDADKSYWRHRRYKETHVRAPFASVDDAAGSTHVEAPFTSVHTNRRGTWVRAPFVDLFVPR
jgi:hypothetical protein